MITLSTQTGSRNAGRSACARGSLLRLGAPVPAPRSPRSLPRSSRSSGRFRGSASRAIATTRSSSSRRIALVRALEDLDAVGHLLLAAPASARSAARPIEAEQRVGRRDLHLVEQLLRRLVLDDDRDVPHLLAEPLRDRRAAPQRRAFRTRPVPRVFVLGVLSSSVFGFRLRAPCRLARARRPAGSSRSRRRTKHWSHSGFGRQMRRPCRISVSDVRVQRSGGIAAHNCCSTTIGSSPSAMPMRLATRRTCRSTGSPGMPSAWPRTTFAVLRPTPGSSTSASIVVRHLAAVIARPAPAPCRCSDFDFARKNPVE